MERFEYIFREKGGAGTQEIEPKRALGEFGAGLAQGGEKLKEIGGKSVSGGKEEGLCLFGLLG